MPFEKGKAKTGGRKVGSGNRTTTDIKSKIALLIDNHFDTIQGDLEDLDPKDRVTAYLKFLEYILPKKREEKIDLSTLTDAEIDALLNKAMNRLE